MGCRQVYIVQFSTPLLEVDIPIFQPLSMWRQKKKKLIFVFSGLTEFFFSIAFTVESLSEREREREEARERERRQEREKFLHIFFLN